MPGGVLSFTRALGRTWCWSILSTPCATFGIVAPFVTVKRDIRGRNKELYRLTPEGGHEWPPFFRHCRRRSS
eukprot:6178082-Amphidinium_carterae.2